MKNKNGAEKEIKIAAENRKRRSLKSSSHLQKHSKHEHHIHGRHKEQSERQPINWEKFESSWKSSSSSASPCSRHELFVDFSRIGWSSWIISPKGYNAFFCKGDCDFPLGHKHSPTNHASVQSIVHELRLMPNVDKPCCVPSKLLPITLLYFDEQENVILKQYDDMVVDSCGCH
ncbi:univin protein-like protein [Leptotrombidium deliense]|uniref:Univin protein-like protein n=1 Tax=Leptotrombidium deliense TaxID=299467 RepID=A0A443SL15_9ACAR|nr:univin protein-like protein [Leptotrombidium deliense]